MATETNDKGGRPPRIFKTTTGKQLQKDLAEVLNAESFKDHTHRDHMVAVTKAYDTYRKLHRSK